MSKVFVWTALIVGGLFIWANKGTSELNKEELLDNKAKVSAALATVKPDNTPSVSPDTAPNTVPDLQDCNLCDGTGYVTHADGHKTPCPYHGSQVQLQELQDKYMTLSEKMAVQQKYGEDLYKYLLDDQEKQKLIIKPEPQKAPTPEKQLKATFCPCGCNHNVANCNCRVSCPGKKLPAYTYVAVKQPAIERREVTTITPLPPETKTPLTPYTPPQAQQKTTTTYQYQYNQPRKTTTTYRSRSRSCGIFGCSSRRGGYSRWRN